MQLGLKLFQGKWSYQPLIATPLVVLAGEINLFRLSDWLLLPQIFHLKFAQLFNLSSKLKKIDNL